MRFRILGVFQSKAKSQVWEKTLRDALYVVCLCSRDCPTGAAGFGVLAALQDRRCDLAWVTAGDTQEILKGQQLRKVPGAKWQQQRLLVQGCKAIHLAVVQKPMGLSRALTTGSSLPGCCGRASAGVLNIGMGQLGNEQ